MAPEEVLGLDRPVFLIDDIVPSESLGDLFGEPKLGKTFLALDWALCVATGLAWLGHPVKRGRVIYVAAEGYRGHGPRLRAWCQERCTTPTCEWIRWRDRQLNLLNQYETAPFLGVVAEWQPSLVVIDTLARSMVGGEENWASHMSVVVDVADRIRRASGATVLFIHHPTKDRRTPRGSSALSGAVDTELELRRVDGALRLDCRLMKDAEACPPISLQLCPVGESLVVRRGAAEKAVPRARNPKPDEALALFIEAYGAGSAPQAAFVHLLMARLKMTHSTASRRAKALRDEGRFANIGTEARPLVRLADGEEFRAV